MLIKKYLKLRPMIGTFFNVHSRGYYFLQLLE
jgi:hypothetical protein